MLSSNNEGAKIVTEFLGKQCFCWCQFLCEVVFEDGCTLKQIAESAFALSGLKSIRIPESVEFLGKGCFAKCESLSEVIFTGEVNIVSDAFRLSPVKNVKIPFGVKLNYSFGEDCIIEFVASAASAIVAPVEGREGGNKIDGREEQRNI
jgi:hypothetical protein